MDNDDSTRTVEEINASFPANDSLRRRVSKCKRGFSNAAARALQSAILALTIAACDCGKSHDAGDAGELEDAGTDAGAELEDAGADVGIACTANCCFELDPVVCEEACGLTCPDGGAP